MHFEYEKIGFHSYDGGFIYVDIDDIEIIEDQLAFLLAHEMAHIDLNHWANKAKMSFKNREDIYKKGFEVKVENWVYDRKQEFQADAYATLYIYKRGYDLESGIHLMNKFKARGKDVRQGYEKFSTHPPFDDRIKSMKDYVEKIKRIESKFQNGVESIKDRNYDLAIKYFEEYRTMFYDSRKVYNNLG